MTDRHPLVVFGRLQMHAHTTRDYNRATRLRNGGVWRFHPLPGPCFPSCRGSISDARRHEQKDGWMPAHKKYLTVEEASEAARSRQARYRAKHIEKVRARAAKWARDKRATDGESFRASRRASYAANFQKRREDARRYAKANPEKRNEIEALRRARKQTTVVERIDRAQIIERDKSTCHICGKKVRRDRIQLDHLIPLSKGGPHTYENLAVSHPYCNQSRGDGRLPAQLRLRIEA